MGLAGILHRRLYCPPQLIVLKAFAACRVATLQNDVLAAGDPALSVLPGCGGGAPER